MKRASNLSQSIKDYWALLSYSLLLSLNYLITSFSEPQYHTSVTWHPTNRYQPSDAPGSSSSSPHQCLRAASWTPSKVRTCLTSLKSPAVSHSMTVSVPQSCCSISIIPSSCSSSTPQLTTRNAQLFTSDRSFPHRLQKGNVDSLSSFPLILRLVNLRLYPSPKRLIGVWDCRF